ncbi:cytochrome c biogenesis CcdA family protein [Micromonospora sp. NPDC005806]|uniref:cytochrome c biogenesis CcdA family protein n=1 Tax=Micromonospora sp. NPDC005806 TaxID=3364234 RepID=UPI003679FA38
MSATALAVAFGGGVVSLLSPCVLPVVPAYLSITTGLGMSEPQSRPDLRPHPESGLPADPCSSPEQRPPGRPGLGAVLWGGGLFVAGFSVVFVALGLSATAIGTLLLRNHVPVTRISGVAVIAMALTLLVSTLRLGWVAGREFRFHPQVSRYGMWAAPVAGAAFAFGWTPCIGPVLGSVLAVAADQRQLAQGSALLAMYAAGLALPFLIIALTFHRSLIALRFVRRHSTLLTRASATVLAGYGVLLAFDQLSWFTLQVQNGATAIGLAWLVGLG